MSIVLNRRGTTAFITFTTQPIIQSAYIVGTLIKGIYVSNINTRAYRFYEILMYQQKYQPIFFYLAFERGMRSPQMIS